MPSTPRAVRVHEHGGRALVCTVDAPLARPGPGPAHQSSAPADHHSFDLPARDPADGWVLADPVPVGPETRAAIRAVVRAMCPVDLPEIAAIPDVVARVERAVRRTMAYMHPVTAFGLRASFLLADWAPLLTLRSTRLLHDHEPAEAEAVLRCLEHGRWRTIARLVAGLRAAVSVGFYDLPEVHALLDYDPAPFMAERVAFRQRLLAGSDPGPADFLPPFEAELLRHAPERLP